MLRAMPILNVPDVVASAAFYERLGFVNHGFWGVPPGFCIIQRGNVTLGLDRNDTAIPRNQYWQAYLYVEDVNALHAEFSALDGVTVSAPYDAEYGCRDFTLTDPDGHRLAFGQDLRPGTHGPGLDDRQNAEGGAHD